MKENLQKLQANEADRLSTDGLDVRERTGKDAELYFLDGKHCVVCGREFYPAPEHRFRRPWESHARMTRWYCSWTCYCRDAPKKQDRRRRPRRPVEMLSPDGEVLREFSDAMVAATLMGFDLEGIRKCCRGKVECYRGFIWRYKEVGEHD